MKISQGETVTAIPPKKNRYQAPPRVSQEAEGDAIVPEMQRIEIVRDGQTPRVWSVFMHQYLAA